MTELNSFFRECPRDNDDFIDNIKKNFQIEKITEFDNIILFGTGELGKRYYRIFKMLGAHIIAFADNNRELWGKIIIDNIKVVSPDELHKLKYSYIIVTSKYVKEIVRQLKQKNYTGIIPHYVLSVLFKNIFNNFFYDYSFDTLLINKENIEKVFGLLADDKSKAIYHDLLFFRTYLLPEYLPEVDPGQYFMDSLWEKCQDEIYADVGAYDGDTLLAFLKVYGKKFNKYYCLEPDAQNFEKLLKVIEKLEPDLIEKIVPICAGAGAIVTSERLVIDGDKSIITDSGCHEIKIIPLDTLPGKNERITAIKVDVEGYEKQVITGAANTISLYKPRLAISIYHKLEDLWDLVLMIINMNKNYKFYIRHHTPEIYDTVLYAI